MLVNEYIKTNKLGERYHDFPSIAAMLEFQENKGLNKPFAEAMGENRVHSKTGTYRFTNTYSLDEALDLLRHGWEVGAKKLNAKVNIKANNGTTQKSQYNVVGGNASVARYLQGIPTNMIEQKRVKKETKVITLNKSIGYNCMYSTDQILDESVKALEIANLIENKGYRVNLNLIWGSRSENSKYDKMNQFFIVKLRLKNANERINVSKTSFPLCHPSMLRRILFRTMEKSSLVTSRRFIDAYGYPIDNDAEYAKEKYAEYMTENEYLLPAIIEDVDKFIKGLGI